jgi:uncharacterized protein (TIGR03435 family)
VTRAAAFVLLSTVIVGAQADGPTAFDVISVRPAPPGASGSPIQPGGRIVWTDATLGAMIRAAYFGRDLDDVEVVGGPDWIDRDRFEVIAQAAGGTPPVDPDGVPRRLQRMLRALLADRFGLVVHEEQRERPMYALVAASSDRRPGPRLRAVTADCGAIAQARLEGRPPPLRPDGRPDCRIGGGPGVLLGHSVTMAELAAQLQPLVGRRVEDRTGMAGVYDWQIDFAPELPGGAGGGPATAAPPTDRPSIFSALQEQLGLKLDATRGLAPVIVVDRAERPTAN